YVTHFAASPSVLPPVDFAMYWAAGRLTASGDNPYDPQGALAVAREARSDLSDEGVFMFSPPWTLPLITPFALLPSRVGQLLWLLCHFIVVLLCADWVWRFYGGPVRYRWVAWILTACFLPTLLLLRMGQIGSLVLLGII